MGTKCSTKGARHCAHCAGSTSARDAQRGASPNSTVRPSFPALARVLRMAVASAVRSRALLCCLPHSVPVAVAATGHGHRRWTAPPHPYVCPSLPSPRPSPSLLFSAPPLCVCVGRPWRRVLFATAAGQDSTHKGKQKPTAERRGGTPGASGVPSHFPFSLCPSSWSAPRRLARNPQESARILGDIPNRRREQEASRRRRERSAQPVSRLL
jgi:hypothetical protein